MGQKRNRFFLLNKRGTVEKGMFELVETILYAVSFIAIGGMLAIIFFFIFAPSILGSKTIHKQLDKLDGQFEKINEQLGKIADCLNETKEERKGKP